MQTCKALQHLALCCNYSAPQEQPVVASDAPQPEAQVSTEVTEVVPAPENVAPAEATPSESAPAESQPAPAENTPSTENAVAESQPSETTPAEPQQEAPKPEAAGENVLLCLCACLYSLCRYAIAMHSLSNCQIMQMCTRGNLRIE